MRPEELYEAIGGIGDDLILRSEEHGKQETPEAQKSEAVKEIKEAKKAEEARTVSGEAAAFRLIRKIAPYVAAAAGIILLIGIGRALLPGAGSGSALVAEEKAAASAEESYVYSEAAEAARTEESAEESVAVAAAPEATAEMAPEEAFDMATADTLGAQAVRLFAAMDERNGFTTESASEASRAGDALTDSLVSPDALQTILSGSAEENPVCSPVNLALALSMCTEITDGTTRQELLSLLGYSNPESLQQAVEAFRRSEHPDTETAEHKVANSIWLRSDQPGYNSETLRRIAENYVTSSYAGEMGSAEYNEMLRTWISENTNGLLSDAEDSFSLREDTVIALLTALYYRAEWKEPLREDTERKDLFRGSREESEVTWLSGTQIASYARGNGFISAGIPLTDGNTCWILLPDEGNTPKQILSSEDGCAALRGQAEAEEVILTITMPSIDVLANSDMTESVRALGATEIFDGNAADFTPLFEMPQSVALSELRHAVRFSLDQNGITAAAVTMSVAAEGAAADVIREETVVCDRPFAYAVTDASGCVYFAGVFEQP